MSINARKDSPQQTEFRQYCQDWLADNHPGEPPVRLPLTALEIMTEDQLNYLQAWQKSAYDAGLIGCDYPVDVGGVGDALAEYPQSLGNQAAPGVVDQE